MEWLPDNYEGFWTLVGTVNREGIGLHTGESGSVELSPSAKRGYHVSWINNENFSITLHQSHSPSILLLCLNLLQLIHILYGLAPKL